MKTAIYVRVSTSNGSQDLENQLVPLREWARRLGATSITEYKDTASGTKGNRTSLNQLLLDAHRGKLDVVLVWALDRLSREGIGKMCGYIEQLKKSNTRLLSHQEPWLDTSGPVSDLLLAIFAWVAKQERDRIVSRVKMGLETAKRNGKTLGRPKLRNDNRIHFLRSQGRSIREIATIVGVSKGTVEKSLAVLLNPSRAKANAIHSVQ